MKPLLAHDGNVSTFSLTKVNFELLWVSVTIYFLQKQGPIILLLNSQDQDDAEAWIEFKFDQKYSVRRLEIVNRFKDPENKNNAWCGDDEETCAARILSKLVLQLFRITLRTSVTEVLPKCYRSVTEVLPKCY